MLNLSHIWPATIGVCSSWLLCFFTWHHFLSTSLVSGTKNVFQAHVVLHLTWPWNWPFLQGALVPFSGEAKIWTLIVFISQTLSVDRAREYIYRYVFTHTFKSIFLYLSIYWKSWVHANFSTPNPTPQVNSSFLPLYFPSLVVRNMILWMELYPPPNLYIEALIPNMMVFEDNAFGR